MRNSERERTILHVEDNPMLAEMVRIVFEGLGFGGTIVRASLVAEAFALLAERECRQTPLDLILLDMQLPDGTGLDVLRQVKASSIWARTPVIMLSGETAPGIVSEAYALGANCYLPKQSVTADGLASIQALYQCWVQEALLPQSSFPARIQGVLTKAVRLRARIAQFYLGLAQTTAANSEEENFWLERALIEGNMSNLLAFFQGNIDEDDLAPDVVERIAGMQFQTERALTAAEKCLMERPSPGVTYRLVLDLAGALDEEVFAETFGALLLKNQKITVALKSRAISQLQALADHVLKRTAQPELRDRANALLTMADRLTALSGARLP